MESNCQDCDFGVGLVHVPKIRKRGALFQVARSCGHRRNLATESAASYDVDDDALANWNQLGVVGAGQMGTGFALAVLQTTPLEVVLHDIDTGQLENAERFIHRFLDRQVDKGRLLCSDVDEMKSRVQVTSSLKDFESVDFVLEAVNENLAAKERVFRDLSRVVSPESILASNTSSISVTKLAASSSRPENAIGMHFVIPVVLSKIAEIVPGLPTSRDTLSKTVALAKSMGKVPIVATDSPGFIAFRLLTPYINEAAQMVQDRVATVEDIDQLMRLGLSVPKGPLEMADIVGLDTCLAIMKQLYGEFADPKYRPAQLLSRYVDAGWLGRKTGRGFYVYPQWK